VEHFGVNARHGRVLLPLVALSGCAIGCGYVLPRVMPFRYLCVTSDLPGQELCASALATPDRAAAI
jgi:hypothetical protein